MGDHPHTHAYFAGCQMGTLYNTEAEQTGWLLIQRLAPPSRPITRQAESLSGAQGEGDALVLVHLKKDSDQLDPSPL